MGHIICTLHTDKEVNIQDFYEHTKLIKITQLSQQNMEMKRTKYTLHQRINTEVQTVQNCSLSLLTGNCKQMIMRCHFTPVKVAYYQKIRNSKFWKGMQKKETSFSVVRLNILLVIKEIDNI